MDVLRSAARLLAFAASLSPAAAQCELQTLVAPAGSPPGFGRWIAQDASRFAVASDGNVRVYVQEGLTAFLEQEIAVPGYAPGGLQVRAIELSGDTLAISSANRVQIYERRGGAFEWVDELWPRANELFFGNVIALDGRRLVVVASEATPPDFPYPYVAIVYERVGPRWTRVARLESPLGAAESFGAALDLDGERLAVGVAGKTFRSEPGRAYVFERTAVGWTRYDLVSARLGYAGFAQTLDLRGDRLVIGGMSATPGELARVFDFDGAAWRETGALATGDVVPEAAAVGIALGGDGLVLAGATWNDERARDGGAVYVFEERAGAWTQIEKLFPSSPAFLQGFGMAVSLDGEGDEIDGELALVGSLNGDVARTYSPRESACRTLSASPAEISLASGGRQTLRLNPGRELAGRTFWLLGSASGFEPGFALRGARVPLVQDWYFRSSLPGTRSAPFAGNVGVLRAPSPQATVTIDVPPGTSLALAGLVLHHAFVVLDGGGVAYVSNARTLTLVP